MRVGAFNLVHARLAVLDVDHRSDQPYQRGRITLVYNGEVWNYRQLRRLLRGYGERFTTTGDTEVIAAMLDRFGVGALAQIEGMFAVAWTDGSTLWLARDRHGEIPLHVSEWPFAFASEIRALRAIGCHAHQWMPPGTYLEVSSVGEMSWHRWYTLPDHPEQIGLDEAAVGFRERILRGCGERAIADVPICTLLSGGVDSALVAAGLSGRVEGLVAYTAVLEPRSRDLRGARETAEMLGLPLVEVPVRIPSGDDLRRTVGVIEMGLKAQVEIAWACLALADAIRSDGFKVTFSGEGADELWASYGFAYHAFAQGADWFDYRRDLFWQQHRKNFARANKVFMSRGIECRLPYLHTDLVEYALNLPRAAVQDGRSRPKAIMSGAARGLVPDSVATRPKVAFQDGLGLKRAIAETLPDPAKLYRNEARRLGV